MRHVTGWAMRGQAGRDGSVCGARKLVAHASMSTSAERCALPRLAAFASSCAAPVFACIVTPSKFCLLPSAAITSPPVVTSARSIRASHTAQRWRGGAHMSSTQLSYGFLNVPRRLLTHSTQVLLRPPRGRIAWCMDAFGALVSGGTWPSMARKLPQPRHASAGCSCDVGAAVTCGGMRERVAHLTLPSRR